MQGAIPTGLSGHMASAIEPLRDKLIARGWTINIQWDDQKHTTLGISGKMPSGRSFYASCDEKSLDRKLQEFLDLD